MKKIVLLFAFALTIIEYSSAQTFMNYYKDGMYKFDDNFKLMKSDVFSTYKSYFGFDAFNDMMMVKEDVVDAIGTTAGRYIQYERGYPVQGTMLNVISKYGVVLYVNGFALPKLNVDVSSPIAESVALSNALAFVNAPHYIWQDAALEDQNRYYLDTTSLDSANYIYDTTRTLYPKGELVIATPYGDTAVHDTSHYALCWKFYITPMSWDTVIRDTSTDSGIVLLDTVIGYRQMENVIVYVDAKTGSIATVDSNRYGGSGFWVTCGVHPTWYEGNQNVQAWTCTFCFNYFAKDSRNIALWDHSDRDGLFNRRSNTWVTQTGPSAYWQLEQSWNYFHDIHGYNGPSGGRNEQYLSFNWTGVPDRANYQPFGPRDDYHIGVDNTTTPYSAAQLDKIAHEYTHAMIHHGTMLNNFGDAAAVAEGLCDYFGYQIANHYYSSRYASDWTSGFGWQSGYYARHFANPGADAPLASSSNYGDFPFLSGEKYRQAGVFRRFTSILSGWLPSIENDVWITMEWWLWSGIDYPGTRDAFLAEYEYYYKKCSPEYRKVQLAWGNVGLPKFIYCKEAYIVSPDVSHMTPSTLHGTDGGSKPVMMVKPTDPTGTGGFPEGHEAVSFQWTIPSSWQVIYNEDHSQITIDTISDMASQMVTCVVTYIDSTKDTLTTFQHFVDGGGAGKTPKNNVAVTDEGLKLFPNPVKNQLNVILPTVPVSSFKLTLIDITGREVYKCVLGNKSNIVNLPELSGGIYIVKIKGDGKDYTRRITIQ